MSILLSAITFAPAMAPHPGMAGTSGTIYANAISPDSNCKPGAICASATFKTNGCFFNNKWNSGVGGTPLTIDVTETGNSGSKVYVYWVNATSQTIAIKKQASANYYCP
ncbi:MAG TPA: hypothetical protein VEW74_01875 [Candidatus Nitrosotalea sp.]|nr:hypothetical protein [Candidatus Nitrosotalea sp.]